MIDGLRRWWREVTTPEERPANELLMKVRTYTATPVLPATPTENGIYLLVNGGWRKQDGGVTVKYPGPPEVESPPGTHAVLLMWHENEMRQVVGPMPIAPKTFMGAAEPQGNGAAR